MTDQRSKKPGEGDIMDTQELLRGTEGLETHYDVDAILAEYGSSPGEAPPSGVPAAQPPEEDAPPPRHTLQPDPELDSISPEEMFGLPRRESVPTAGVPAAEAAAPGGKSVPPERDAPPEAGTGGEPASSGEEVPISVTMEDVVANTVDAVKDDLAKRQEKWKRKLERERKKENRQVRRREPKQRPLPEIQEPSLQEAASRYRRRYLSYRASRRAALPVLLLMWAPWLLDWMGVELPYFSSGGDAQTMTVLAFQAVMCGVCWPLFRAAGEDLRAGELSGCVFSALCSIVTLLDAVTALFLPGRASVPPLGGVASAGLYFNLWGLERFHQGMGENLRTAGLGRPVYAVDLAGEGVAKGRGTVAGFYTRAAMEDSPHQWQRLLMPVLAAASLVFAVLSSVGRERWQDILWCWSAILCAAASLVFPLAYNIPFGKLSARLGRSGAALAGEYGAEALAASSMLVVTDQDLFPGGTVALNGLKLYGEERDRALSYAGSLVIQGGGGLARVFDEQCRGDRIPLQPLDHFHIHDEGGLSAIIHGETVLVGPPIFMRHRAVKLPATMPARTSLCLAVDGTLTAVFSIKYAAGEPVEAALHALGRNGMRLALATRDGNIGPKLLRSRFGTDGDAVLLERSERLAYSDPEREAGGPNGLLYREGLYPYVELVSGSRRLCQIIRLGTLLAVLGSIFGCLVSFYLAFAGSYSVLSPLLLLCYLLLWTAPVLPLLWGIDKT